MVVSRDKGGRWCGCQCWEKGALCGEERCCGFDLHQRIIFSSQLPLLLVWGVSVTLNLASGVCRSSRERCIRIPLHPLLPPPRGGGACSSESWGSNSVELCAHWPAHCLPLTSVSPSEGPTVSQPLEISRTKQRSFRKRGGEHHVICFQPPWP